MLLAGDVGGTKTVLALFGREDEADAPLAEATFASAEYASLEAVVEAFAASVDLPIERACIGVAGPVVAGEATVTNLPWRMSEACLARALGLSFVRLVNDLEAVAYAVPSLTPDDLLVLNEGQAVPTGNVAVIAPGTGLGEAFLTWDGTRYHAHASEGGHADFAPTNNVQQGLLRYLHQTYEHVSYERVCSGKGMPNIYAFLKESGLAVEPSWLAERLADVEDPVPLIVDAALGDLAGGAPCPLAVATLDTFVGILGAAAGNLALTVLATGGIYVGGGIPPRILPFLERPAFLDALRRKGRFADLLLRAPVRVILNPRAALLGAARFGLDAAPS